MGLKDRVKQNAEVLGYKTNPKWDDDLIPDLGDEVRVHGGDELGQKLEAIGIDGAYRQWCGKSEPKQQGKRRESVMVSCPKPDHADRNPSAWLNLDKGVWYCGACGQGGDAYDLAAFRHNFSVPGYKEKDTFKQLRARMQEDLGIKPLPPQEPEAAEAAPDKRDNSEAVTPQQDQPPTLTVVPDLAERVQEAVQPEIDWRSILPADSFLYNFCKEGHKLDPPDEFFFWLGLIGIGLAIGRDVQLEDALPVKANFFVCLYGPTGVGKSKSTHLLSKVLEDALPYDDAPDVESPGTMQMGTPGSGEIIVSNFEKIELDPADPKQKKILRYNGVRGLVEVNELSALAATIRRNSSTVGPVLIDLYDCSKVLRTSSRGHGNTQGHNHFGCALTTTQPIAIRNTVNDSDMQSGFLNRWIFAMGPTKPRNYERVVIDYDRLSDDLIAIKNGHPAFRTSYIEMTPDARNRWIEFDKTEIWPWYNDKTTLPIYKRIDLTLKKIALAFAANEHETSVTLDIVERVLTLFPYLKLTCGIIAQDLTQTELSDACEKIERMVVRFTKRKNVPPTRREITQYIKGVDPELMTKALRVLETLGALQEEEWKPKRGANVTRYRWVN